jgi:hypothetical protein
MTFAASPGDIIGLTGAVGTVAVAVAPSGVLTMTRVTPFDVTTVVVARPSVLVCDVALAPGADGADGAGGAAGFGAAVAPVVVTPGVAAP